MQILDGNQLVDLHHDFEVAPGDANDIQVVNAHTWGCDGLVFSDGQVAATSLHIAECGPSVIGARASFYHFYNTGTDLHSYVTAIAGKKTDMLHCGGITRSDCGGKVAAEHSNHDVLLRKRA